MVDVESVAVISTEASGEAFPWSGVELFDKSRGGDETRHKYLTYSEWHTDSKFVGLLKVGYQASILEINIVVRHCLQEPLTSIKRRRTNTAVMYFKVYKA